MSGTQFCVGLIAPLVRYPTMIKRPKLIYPSNKYNYFANFPNYPIFLIYIFHHCLFRTDHVYASLICTRLISTTYNILNKWTFSHFSCCGRLFSKLSVVRGTRGETSLLLSNNVRKRTLIFSFGSATLFSVHNHPHR